MFEVFQDVWHSNKEILVRPGMLPCLVPPWPQIMQNCISDRSRSDLVLDTDHSLDSLELISFYRHASRFVVFQRKWETTTGADVKTSTGNTFPPENSQKLLPVLVLHFGVKFLPFSTVLVIFLAPRKVAHFCFCLVRIKMPLLT